MLSETEMAYRAWRKAAEKGYGKVKVDNPVRMQKIDARIRRLKAHYEDLLRAEKQATGNTMI